MENEKFNSRISKIGDKDFDPIYHIRQCLVELNERIEKLEKDPRQRFKHQKIKNPKRFIVLEDEDIREFTRQLQGDTLVRLKDQCEKEIEHRTKNYNTQSNNKKNI